MSKSNRNTATRQLRAVERPSPLHDVTIDNGVRLDCDEILGLGVAVEERVFGRWGKKICFDVQVIKPVSHAGAVLTRYVNVPTRSPIPRSCELAKILEGIDYDGGSVAEAFIGREWLCKIRTSTDGRYSVIQEIRDPDFCDELQWLLQFWNQPYCPRPHKRLTPLIIQAYRRRRSQGYSDEEIINAIKNYHRLASEHKDGMGTICPGAGQWSLTHLLSDDKYWDDLCDPDWNGIESHFW